jgi:flavin-dependent dehydrogenase
MTDYDVIVVGGGPVGMAAAIEARLSGLSAVVVEPRSGAIDKACGEGLMPGAIPLLARLGVYPTGRDLAGVTYRSGGHAVSHRFSSGVGKGVRRTELHGSLRSRSEELGVVFVEASVGSVTESESGLAASCSNGTNIQGRYLIAADGLHSSIAKAAGLVKALSPRRSKRFGIRQHFHVAPWSEFIEVFYTKTAEVYITPVSEDQVGVAVLGPKSTDFDETIASIPELAGRLEGAAPASQRSGAGSFPQLTTARTKGRILLVGDASGYVDAITGEGLRLGFAQARVAIECILSDKPASYERAWRRVSRDFRVLTGGLISAANSPIRMAIVPLASRLPWVFGLVVNRLAR